MKIERDKHGYSLWMLTPTGYELVQYIPFEDPDITAEMLLELP